MHIDYKRRIFGLDLIRAIAIMLVMISHSTILLFPDSTSTVISIVQFFGSIGVDLFFVLSGYLIGGLILKQIDQGRTQIKDLSHFWIRRWFRTLPNYFLILVVNICLVWWFFKEVNLEIGSYFFFLQNFASPHPNFFTEAWTLSIEEFSYIIGPLLIYLLFLIKIANRKFVFLIVSSLTILTASLLRLKFHLDNQIIDYSFWSQNIRKVVIYRFDAIYYGFFAIYIARYHSHLWHRIRNTTFVVAVLLFLGMHGIMFTMGFLAENSALFYNVFYLPFLAISLLLFFPKATTLKYNGSAYKMITKISVLSYALYLVNFSIIVLSLHHLIDVTELNVFLKMTVLLLYWLLSFILAYLLYRFYERPMTNLRDRRVVKSIF